MNKQFWKADWFLGVVIAVGMLIFNMSSNLIPGLERWAYDLGVRMTSKAPSDKIAVIAIDEQSIANIGRWPWPRDVQAKLIDQLSAAKAKVIGNTVFFFEPQKDPGLAYVEKMLALYDKAYPGGGQPDAPAGGVFGGAAPAAAPGRDRGDRQDPARGLERAQQRRAPGRVHEEVGNVVVPMVFDETMGVPPPRQARPAPSRVRDEARDQRRDREGRLLHLRRERRRPDRADRRQRLRHRAPERLAPTRRTAPSAPSRS